MKYFNYRKRNLISGPHLLGVLLMIAGLFALVSPTFLIIGTSIERVFVVGIGAFVLGIFILFSYDGTLTDIKQNRFKEYQSVGGYKFGKWVSLPAILNIKVISNTYISSNTPNGISPTFSGEVTDIKTFLYSHSPEPILKFKYSNKDEAVKHAQRLAAVLNADLILQLSTEE